MRIRLHHIIFLATFFLLVAGYFIGHIWKQDQYVSLVKEERKLDRNIQNVYNSIVKLQMELSHLKDFRRLEKLGEEKYGYVYHGIPKFVYPKRVSHEK